MSKGEEENPSLMERPFNKVQSMRWVRRGPRRQSFEEDENEGRSGQEKGSRGRVDSILCLIRDNRHQSNCEVGPKGAEDGTPF